MKEFLERFQVSGIESPKASGNAQNDAECGDGCGGSGDCVDGCSDGC